MLMSQISVFGSSREYTTSLLMMRITSLMVPTMVAFITAAYYSIWSIYLWENGCSLQGINFLSEFFRKEELPSEFVRAPANTEQEERNI